MGIRIEPKPAYNVFHALNWCSPQLQLKDGYEVFYVDRGQESPIDEMKEHLLAEIENPKILLTGPKGSGKATELLKLSQDGKIRKYFYTSIFPGKRDTIELITVMLKQLIKIAKDNKIKFTDEMKSADDFIRFKFGWNEEVEVTATPKKDVFDEEWVEPSKSDDKKVRLLKRKIATVEPVTISTWIGNCADEIRKHKGKEPLLIITELDKIDLPAAREMFFDKVRMIAGLKCFIIYTFPIELCYRENFNQIRRYFSEIYYFKPIYPWSGEDTKKWNYDRLRDLLTKRIKESLFDPMEGTIDALIKYSGGVPEELFDLAMNCALISSRRAHPLWIWTLPILWQIWLFFISPKKHKITLDIFMDHVVTRRKNRLEQTITQEQRLELQRINEDRVKFDPKKEAHQEILYRGLVIQHGPEKDPRYILQPIVKEFLEQPIGHSVRSGKSEEFE